MASVKPVRKLYYNMTITFVSIIVALVVGGIEALGFLVGQFHLAVASWNSMNRLKENFGLLGYCIVGLFTFSWLVSVAVYKWRGFDDVELRSGS